METFVETERTFELPDGIVLPDLTVPAATVVAAPLTIELVATYSDTADFALARAHVTLRRRQGGTDDGWHLKLPAGTDQRREVHRPLGRGTTVPLPLRRAVSSLILGAELRKVVEVRTTRTVHVLVGTDQLAVAEVCDDQVDVTRLDRPGDDPAAVQSWREVEVELTGGDADLLERVSERLTDAGGRVADHQSKLRRALGNDLPPRHIRPEGLRRRAAGTALWDYLALQSERLADREVEVRLGLHDGEHQMRITARRLRSALAVSRPLLDKDTARHLESELRWLGQELSEVRDLEVMRERLLEAVAAEQSPVAVRAMSTPVRSALRTDERAAMRRAREALDSRRHIELRASLKSLLADPPFTDKAAKRAKKVLDRRIAKTWRRFVKRVAAADEAGGTAHDEALHAVRKAAKRLRYAAEMAEPTLGKPADQLRTRAQAVQKALGNHQDSVVAREWYERLGREATSTAVAFGFGRLHALEQAGASRYEEAYAAAVAELRTVTSLR